MTKLSTVEPLHQHSLSEWDIIAILEPLVGQAEFVAALHTVLESSRCQYRVISCDSVVPISELEAQQGSVPSDLRERSPALITLRGGTGGGGGTWAHPDIAIQFAQWCSPAFALQVSRWVREWMSSGRNPLADILLSPSAKFTAYQKIA